MTSETGAYRRISRRETHSSRAGWAITVAAAVMASAAAAGVASVYLIVHPSASARVRDGFDGAAALDSPGGHRIVAVCVAAVLIGIVLIVVAVAPGHRARRSLEARRAVVIADDKVIARALAKTAAGAAEVPRDQVEVRVGRTRAVVRLTPLAGAAIDPAAVVQAVSSAGVGYGLWRTPRVLVAQRAVVG
jgi:hypothetical protein